MSNIGEATEISGIGVGTGVGSFFGVGERG